MMLRSTKSPESIGSRSLTSFSSANVTVPPGCGLPAAGAADAPPLGVGVWVPVHAATRIASMAMSGRTRAERILTLPTEPVSVRIRPPALRGSAAHALLALTPDRRRGHQGTTLAYGLALFDALGRSRRGRCPRHGVRRREHAAEPAGEDRREEAEERTEGDRVARGRDVEIAHARHHVREALHARDREESAVRGVAGEHEDEYDEEAEERGHHAVPARPIARHAAGDVAADQVREEKPEGDGDRRREIVRPNTNVREQRSDRRPAQREPIDDGLRTEIEMLLDELADELVAHLARPERLHVERNRTRAADHVRDLHLETIGEPRLHHVLRDVAKGVGRGTVDLRW